jgi:hypothetical protein
VQRDERGLAPGGGFAAVEEGKAHITFSLMGDPFITFST